MKNLVRFIVQACIVMLAQETAAVSQEKRRPFPARPR